MEGGRARGWRAEWKVKGQGSKVKDRSSKVKGERTEGRGRRADDGGNPSGMNGMVQ